ncbi:hypothetical protein J5N97_001801, partial [Dioscorea zingiberensis]
MDWVFSEPLPSLFPLQEELVKLLFVVVIASSVAVAFRFTDELSSRDIHKPFCDSSESFLDLEPDSCEPCPDNGHCSNGELKCFHGYKNMEGEGLEHHVCDSYAQFLCVGKLGKHGSVIMTIFMVPEADILNILNENKLKKRIDLKDGTFEFAKSKAMENIERSLETRSDIFGNKDFKCPDMSAELHKPLLCRTRQWMYKHLLHMLAVSALLIGLMKVLWRIKERRSLLTRAEELYEQ